MLTPGGGALLVDAAFGAAEAAALFSGLEITVTGSGSGLADSSSVFCPNSGESSSLSSAISGNVVEPALLLLPLQPVGEEW